MALKLQIKCRNDEIHTLLVTVADETEYDFDIETPDHDAAYEQTLEALGGEECRCYQVGNLFLDCIREVLEDTEISTLFIEAVGKQGVETFGADEDELAMLIIDFIDYSLQYNESLEKATSDVLSLVSIDWPWFKNTHEFKRRREELALRCFNADDSGMFSILNEMSGGGLIDIKETEDEEGSECGAGCQTNIVTVKILINDTTVDEWTFGFRGWFCSIDFKHWHVERIDNSGTAECKTEEFLKAAGFEGGSDDIELKYRPNEPELPKRSDEGSWIIMHDDYAWGRFETEDNARLNFDAIMDESRAGYGQWGTELRLMHVPEGADPDDEDTWEEIESESV